MPLARRWLYERHGDKDLDVDESGDKVLNEMLGAQTVQQLREGMAVLNMKPRDLFRMLMGSMLGDEKQADEGGLGSGLLDALKQMQQLQK